MRACWQYVLAAAGNRVAVLLLPLLIIETKRAGMRTALHDRGVWTGCTLELDLDSAAARTKEQDKRELPDLPVRWTWPGPAACPGGTSCLALAQLY